MKKVPQTAAENLFSVLVEPPVAESPACTTVAANGECSCAVEPTAPPIFRAATELDLDRLARARVIATETLPSDLVTLSARVPPRLEAYLSNYVFRRNISEPNGRKHIAKQDAVTEALAFFVAAYPLQPAPDDELKEKEHDRNQ